MVPQCLKLGFAHGKCSVNICQKEERKKARKKGREEERKKERGREGKKERLSEW